MNDRPSASELLATVREWLSTQALPTLKQHDSLGYQALIAMHVLGIVERELQAEERQLADEVHWLSKQMVLTMPTSMSLPAMRDFVRRARQELCEKVRRGDFDEPEQCLQLLEQLKESVRRKLEVNNPQALISWLEPR